MMTSEEYKRINFINDWILGKACEYRGFRKVGIGQLVLNAPESVREKLRTLKSDDLNHYRNDIVMGTMMYFDHAGNRVR